MTDPITSWIKLQGLIMTDFLNSIAKMPPVFAIVILLLAIIILGFSKWDDLTGLFRWLTKKRAFRTCSDCLLIMMGMKDKYQADIDEIDKNILKAQMNYVEIQFQDTLFNLTSTFRKDVTTIGADRDISDRLEEMALYREALRNALYAIKDELRRSFKENGFIDMSEIEFSSYVKMKFSGLLTIGREYMSQHYTETAKTIVGLQHRFSTFDSARFEDIAFNCYRNAKQIVLEARKKKEAIKIGFHDKVDGFVKHATKGQIPEGC